MRLLCTWKPDFVGLLYKRNIVSVCVPVIFKFFRSNGVLIALTESKAVGENWSVILKPTFISHFQIVQLNSIDQYL